MSPIRTLLLTALLAISALALSAESRAKDDVFTAVSKMLVGSTKSGKFLDNIKSARKILKTGKGISHSPDAALILKQFVALQPIVEQQSAKSFACSSGDMALMRDISETMRRHSKGNAFERQRSKCRIESLVANLQQVFGRACLIQFDTEYKRLSGHLEREKVEAISQFSNLLTSLSSNRNLDYALGLLESAAHGVHLARLTDVDMLGRWGWSHTIAKMHNIFHPRRAILTSDLETGKLHLTYDEVAEMYAAMVSGSCEYFASAHKDVAAVLKRTVELARSIRLTNGVNSRRHPILELAEVAACYQVCEDLRNVDQTKIIRSISSS